MNDDNFLENLKDIIRSEICSRCPGGFDSEKLAIDYNDDMDARIKRFLDLICQLTERLRIAREGDDEITMQAALMRIRTHAATLASTFDSVVHDTETLVVTGKWPEIPENYHVPE